MTIGKRIKELRQKLGYAQTELANRIGISKQNLYKYENDIITNIPADKIELLAVVLKTTPAYLTGWEERFPPPKETSDTTTFRIIGDIAAGYDITAEENWDGEEIEIPNSYIKGKKEDYFVLRVKGDSMYPDYQDGDCVLIKRQSALDHSGQIGAIVFDGEYATLKRVEYRNGEDWMKLIPINTLYPPKTIRNEELEQCFVLGVPKLLIRTID